jgi:hypothetical protein
LYIRPTPAAANSAKCKDEWETHSSHCQWLFRIDPASMHQACPPTCGRGQLYGPVLTNTADSRYSCFWEARSASSTRIPGESLRVPERTWQEMTAVVTEGQKQRAGSKHRGDHWGRVSQAHINLGILCSENAGHSPKPTPIHSLSARLSQQAQGRTATLAAATAIAASAATPDTAIVSPEPTTPIKNSKQH